MASLLRYTPKTHFTPSIPTGAGKASIISDSRVLPNANTRGQTFAGLSLCLLEALAYKNALVCSDIPENTSVAEDKAIYFKKGNVEDLAAKLSALCDDREFVEKLRDGVDEFILNKYSWQDVAQATCKLYEK